MKNKTIKLPIIINTLCQYNGPEYVEITEEEYNRLYNKYGDFYFIGPTTIKYFDNKGWHLANI